MKKLIFAALVILSSLYVSGCTEPVPPGYVGKIVGSEGVQPDVYPPGRVTINPFGRSRLVLIETASALRPADVKVTMADPVMKSDGTVENRIGLDMDFILNIRYRLRADDDILTAMLKDMRLDASVESIGVAQVYEKYGNMAVGRVAREVLGKYTPEQVLGNLETINTTLDAKLKEAMLDTPLIISSASLGPTSLPPLITARINKNKETELSEAEKRAQQQIDMLEKQNQKALADQQALIDEVQAQSVANQNNILRASITPEVLELRRLNLKEKEIAMMERALANGNNNSVFIPYGAMESTGVQQRMYQK